MATSIEAQGLSVDEAIQIALNQLGVSRDKVEIDILHHPRRGVLGIGARRAKVRATIRESVMSDGEEFDMSGDSDDGDRPRRRRRRGGRTGRGESDRPQQSEQAASSEAPREGGRAEEGDRRGGGRQNQEGGRGRDDRRGGRGRDRRGGDRAGGNDARSGGGQRSNNPPREGNAQQAGNPREAEASRDTGGQRDQQDARGNNNRQDGRDGREGSGGGRGRNRRGRGRDDRRERNAGADGNNAPATGAETAPAQQASAQEPKRRQDSRSGPVGTVVQPFAPSEDGPMDAEALEAVRVRAEELVREMLAKMNFEAEVSSSVDEQASEVIVTVRSDSEGLLIGRRGQTLDSLEHVVNRMAVLGDTPSEGRVQLDIGDYRRRRRESLEELATRLRGRTTGERRTVQVSPMSPRDRKFFAQAFADDDSVEVRALGTGFYRRVIVVRAGAQEEAGTDTAAETTDNSQDAVESAEFSQEQTGAEAQD